MTEFRHKIHQNTICSVCRISIVNQQGDPVNC